MCSITQEGCRTLLIDNVSMRLDSKSGPWDALTTVFIIVPQSKRRTIKKGVAKQIDAMALQNLAISIKTRPTNPNVCDIEIPQQGMLTTLAPPIQ